MSTRIKKFGACLLLFMSVFCLSSCEEDEWEIERNIVGRWQIVNVMIYGGESCPYREGDIMDFAPDGSYAAWGRGNFQEQGYWEVNRHYLILYLTGNPSPDMECNVRYNGDYDVVLEVNDMDYGRYTLQLSRY